MESLPPIKKAIGCKWVYKIKYHSNGCIERFKPRPVIFGNNHFEGIGYHETFSPVVKMVTLRTLLAVTTTKKWELHQMNFYYAFLHNDLKEECI